MRMIQIFFPLKISKKTSYDIGHKCICDQLICALSSLRVPDYLRIISLSLIVNIFIWESADIYWQSSVKNTSY